MYWDWVGLRIDRERLAVGDRAAQLAERVLEDRQTALVGGDRVRNALALDQPHVLPGGRDEQPVGLDGRERQQLTERPCPRLPAHAWSSSSSGSNPGSLLVGAALGSGALSSTSPSLSGRSGTVSVFDASR